MSGGNKDDTVCGYHGHFPNAAPSTTVQSGFGKFYKCTKFSDITLVDAARNKIAAHRLVLSAGSKRFDELLHQEKGPDVSEISCVDIEPCTLHSMIKYLYTSNCDMHIHNAVKLLAAALLYECHDLESMSNLYIHIHLNTATCCFFFSEAQKHHIEHISRKCVYIASLDFNSVMRTPSFCNLSVEDLMALLGSPRMGALPKLLLYKAGCAWMMQDVSRLGKFKDVLLCIQMGGHTSDELESFFNPAQGSTDGIRTHYSDPSSTVDSVVPNNRSLDRSAEINRVGSAQSTTPRSRITPISPPPPQTPSLRAPHGTSFEPQANNLASVGSHVKSDSASDSHMDTTPDQSRATSINVAFYSEQLGLNQKQATCHCSHLRATDPVVSGESAQSVKMMSGEDASPLSEISTVQKAQVQRSKQGGGKNKKGQSHTCQVEGCTKDLQELKEYHNRYKICNYHLKVNSIIKDGQQQRFCQQCGRFHLLSEFDNKKRSCRARLIRHNERRRKRMKNGTDKTKQQQQQQIQCMEQVNSQEQQQQQQQQQYHHHHHHQPQQHAPQQQGPFLSFPPAAISPQHLLYLSQMNPMKGSAAQSNGMDGCYPNEKTVAATCLQLVPAEMDRCFMLSPVNAATAAAAAAAAAEQQHKTNKGKHEKSLIGGRHSPDAENAHGGKSSGIGTSDFQHQDAKL